MGLVRSLARKVIGKVTGGGEPAPAQRAAPASAVTPVVAAPAPVARTAEAEPVAEAESLATIECGAQELVERIGCGEFVVMVDVREPSEVASGVIPGARLIPLPELERRWRELEDADEIVCYCAVGARSLRAARFLREQGLFNATSLEGGFAAWRSAGGAVTSPDGG